MDHRKNSMAAVEMLPLVSMHIFKVVYMHKFPSQIHFAVSIVAGAIATLLQYLSLLYLCSSVVSGELHKIYNPHPDWRYKEFFAGKKIQRKPLEPRNSSRLKQKTWTRTRYMYFSLYEIKRDKSSTDDSFYFLSSLPLKLWDRSRA